VLSISDRRRFFSALLAGQLGALVALVLFGGVLVPMGFAFFGSAAGPLLLAHRGLA
jgi:hypothetical protein